MPAIKLPRDVAGYKLDALFSIEMNGLDIETLIPALFWLIRTQGKDRANRSVATNVLEPTQLLAQSTEMLGFRDETGLRLLDRWVRCSLIATSRVGNKRQGEQIAHIRPLSYLAYKPSLGIASRMRQAHTFLYYLLLRHLEKDDSKPGNHLATLDKIIREGFAEGIELDNGDIKDGRYDEKTPLDLEILLQLRYLDGFDAPRERVRNTSKIPPRPSLEVPAHFVAQDVISFLVRYRGRIPSSILSRYLNALLGFSLLIYTLRLMRATAGLVFGGENPPEFNTSVGTTKLLPPIDLYADMTRNPAGDSGRLAHAAVTRHLEGTEKYLRAMLALRCLDRFVMQNRDIKRDLVEPEGGKYLIALWNLRDNSDVRSDFRKLEHDIKQLYKEADENEELPLEVVNILEHPTFEQWQRVTELLAQLQEKSALSGIIKWYSAIGGFEKSDGILRGNQRGKRVWRYEMSDFLLETLVQLAAVSPEVQQASGYPTHSDRPMPITLTAFLDHVKHRYGLLLAEPPSFANSTEATAASRDNLQALRVRLRQMGLFQDLSDDFNAQRLTPRFR